MTVQRSPVRRLATAVGLGVVVGLAGCGTGDDGATGTAAARDDRLPDRYVVPGERAFPEGIGAQKSTGDFFVGGATDGTIYRGNLRRPRMEVFLPGGRDGRTEATAVRIRDGRLSVAGRSTDACSSTTSRPGVCCARTRHLPVRKGRPAATARS